MSNYLAQSFIDFFFYTGIRKYRHGHISLRQILMIFDIFLKNHLELENVLYIGGVAYGKFHGNWWGSCPHWFCQPKERVILPVQLTA